MGLIEQKKNVNIGTEFTNYCIQYGYNSSNCERLTTDNMFDMLYVCHSNRVKHKRYTRDAYEFEKDLGRNLLQMAEEVATLNWRPKGYKKFQVYHPTREINAPLYSDRIVEQWMTEKYIIPFWEEKVLPRNLACQKGKGHHKAMEAVRAAIEMCYEKYGTDFWFFQGDMQGYYDNISHAYVKEINKGMNPYGYFLLCNIVDSWEETECYAKKNDPDGQYGVPKGNLPSQWIGITILNEFDHLVNDRPDCIIFIRYMDDFICFFPTKKSCVECRDFAIKYFKEKKIGVRLHPAKTKIAPISQGFNYCGWHYKLRDDGSVEVHVRQDRKKLKKKQLKSKQKAYAEEKITWEEVSSSIQSTFAHYEHGDTKNLRKYICNRYRFQRGQNKKQKKYKQGGNNRV